ncbi:VWA domain-containing protein, partial [Candidatus Poribacteria bacterium]
CQKKIVLMTDGNENVGNVLNKAEMVGSGDAQIYTVPLSTRGADTEEVLMDGLIGPGSAALGRAFELRAIVDSTVDTVATLRLFRDKLYLTEEKVELSADKKNVFRFLQSLDSEGAHVYEVLVEPLADTMRENNSAKALVTTGGRPEALYVASDEAGADYLYQTLKQKGMEVVLLTDPSRLPASLSEVQNYNTIIFDDVPADSFSAAQMQMIESYVHDLGGGFVMIGGQSSFGSGNYHETPVENVLPVKVIPERKKRSLSIVLAIDRSGSMAIPSGGYVKLDLAKEAAASVVGFLTDKDQMGVVAFDAEAQEIVRLEKVESKGKIEDKIATIRAGGGTNVYPALEVAHRWLKNADTQLKHVILASDGKSQQSDDAYRLVSEMAQDKITVSTIAIGVDADSAVMGDLADLGQGRYYETNDAGELPRIFVKEAFAASKLIMEGDFRPVVSENTEILKGITTDSLPPLRGYVGTSLKDGASDFITSDTGDPILAGWQYGLGRALAFTSDTRPKWAVQWLRWENFSKFWSQAIGWSLAASSGEFHASANIVGNMGSISVDAMDSNGRFRNFLDFQANVVGPNLTRENITLQQSGPGRYEATFDAGQMGTYLVHVSEMKDGKALNSQNTGAVASYSPEYKDIQPNLPLLRSLAAATGGRFNPEPADIATHGEAGVWKLQTLWRLLVLLAILLFFLDVALRRIAVSREQLSRLRARIRPPEDEEYPDAETGTLVSLRHRKERIWGKPGTQRDMLRERQDVVQKGEEAKKKNVSISPSPHPSAPSPAESAESHTSRLLKAKKRAEQSKN